MSRVIIEIPKELLDGEKLFEKAENSKGENPFMLMAMFASILAISKILEDGDINISSEDLLNLYNSREEKDRKFVDDLLIDISAIMAFNRKKANE